VIFILRCALARGEDFSRLGILSEVPPLSLFDVLLATGVSSGTWCSPCDLWSALLGGSFIFLDRVLPFCSLYSLFFGCFDLFMNGRISCYTSKILLILWVGRTFNRTVLGMRASCGCNIAQGPHSGQSHGARISRTAPFEVIGYLCTNKLWGELHSFPKASIRTRHHKYVGPTNR
jgi:hypothetical protein